MILALRFEDVKISYAKVTRSLGELSQQNVGRVPLCMRYFSPLHFYHIRIVRTDIFVENIIETAGKTKHLV